jgi:hypothetical protein
MEIFENPMFGSFTWKYGDPNDDKAKQAYRSVLLLGPDNSIYDAPSADLVGEWKRRSADKFNVSYNVSARVNFLKCFTFFEGE